MALPKWVGWLASSAAVATVAWTMAHPGAPLPNWIAAITTLVAMFTHSTPIPGTAAK